MEASSRGEFSSAFINERCWTAWAVASLASALKGTEQSDLSALGGDATTAIAA